GPKTHDASIELVRSLAGALEEAHRLGLAHGHLGPGQVWVADGKPPKLDFTGIDAGFPAGSDVSRALDEACRDPESGGGLAADRSADLYSLGVLLVWLLTGRTDRTDHALSGAGLEVGSPFGRLIRELLAADPSERPTAHEVHDRLVALAGQFDSTGEWGG